MIKGKWYAGNEDLSCLGRAVDDKDTCRWHLHITDAGKTAGYCALEYTDKGWCMLNLEYSSKLILDLIMRQICQKLGSLGGGNIYAEGSNELITFGFEYIDDHMMAADKILLPNYCKG